ncbi:hypothetical protein [Variovorax sp. GB1P17]|uniref:hypothetical protein n=1 Tax=Variovorax sp. GB1P17 TaxID=3443740 RepID=UPI003F47E3DA
MGDFNILVSTAFGQHRAKEIPPSAAPAWWHFLSGWNACEAAALQEASTHAAPELSTASRPEAVTATTLAEQHGAMFQSGGGVCFKAADWQSFCAALAARAAPGQALTGIAGDWYCESHPEHLMGHDGCAGAGVIESARIPMFVALLKSARQKAREAEQFRDDVVARVRNGKKEAQ